MNDDDLSQLLKQHASRHPAGEALRAAVRTQVALQTAAREQASIERSDRWAWLRGGWQGLGLVGAAGLAAGVVLTLTVVQWRAADQAADLADEIVAGHVRALQVGPLYEVASSDRHQVKPWFQGRLDYAPAVVDSVPGFALLGGRVQPVRAYPTAVLAYQVRLHKIDLFVWPQARGAAPESLHRRGFNLVHWGDGAMQYWAVSDLDGAELERFGAAWRAAATGLTSPR
jgi:anti-sigma factor RsiW